MQELKGSFVALVTPMKSNGEIDFPALKELVEWHIESGTHGLVSVGPSSAFGIGENVDDPISMYLNDVLTVPVNLAGLPAISIPAGYDQNNLPLGLQLIGKSFDEQTILNNAYAIEQSINFKPNFKDWWM